VVTVDAGSVVRGGTRWWSRKHSGGAGSTVVVQKNSGLVP